VRGIDPHKISDKSAGDADRGAGAPVALHAAVRHEAAKRMRPVGDERGFGLAEALISAGLLVAVAAGVTQVLIAAVRVTDAARLRTVATIAAVQKMEQLRSLAWTERRDPASGTLLRVSDYTTDVSSDPPTGAGRGLQASPSGTLDASLPLYADFLAEDGHWLGSGGSLHPAAVLARRWAVRPLESDPANTLVLEVVVTRARGPSMRQPGRPGSHDVLLTTVRTRRQ
jgi:hypothetical protein